jgi:YVTN family beta-propeller protein
MQPHLKTDSLRRTVRAVAVVLSAACGIGVAAALTVDRHARPAAEKAPAAQKAASAHKAPSADKAGAAYRAPAAHETSAADQAHAPLGALRSHGHALGLVAPASAQQRGTAVRGHASRLVVTARPLVRLLAFSSRSRKPKPDLVTASALLDPKVSVGTQPTGVAVSSTRAYVANQGSNSVSVIDLTQNPPVVVATVPVGTQPDSAALSANGARLYAANFGSGTVSVIDTATNSVTKTVTVGTRPTGVVEVGGLVYVANLGSSSVSVFDPTLAVPVVTSFSVPATASSLSAPSGLAASANGQRLYVNDARNGKTFVFDLTQSPPVSTANVVNGTDTFPAYISVSGTTGYSANPGSNSIRVLDLTAFTATNVPVGTSPYGVVALPSLGQAFAANSGTDDLTVIDTSGTPTALAPTVATGDMPDAIAVSPNGQTAVVSNEGEGTVSIFHVNQPPANTVPGAQSLVYNATAAVHHTVVFSTAAGKQLSTNDADSAASASPLKVTLSVAHGTLTLAQTTGLTFLSGANGQASMSFTGLQADVNAALNGLVYEPASVFFGSDALAFTVDDQGGTGLGTPQVTSSSVAIAVTDTTPSDITLSPASVNENQPVGTTVGSLSTTDPDGGDTQTYSLVSGTGSTDNGSFTLSGNTLQTSAVFNFEAKSSYSIRVRSTDAGGLSFEKALTVTVNNVNEAPVNTVPAAAPINEDTALNFTGANTVSVADVDAGAGAIQIQLSVTNGTLTMTTLTGLSFTVGDGTADAAMTFTGTLAAANTALATLRYDPTANFPGAAASGTAAFSITTNDQGNSGSGGPLTDTDGTTITVNQVNDPPVGGTDSAQTVPNVQLFYDTTPGAGVVGTTKTTASTNGLLDNDSDPVEGSTVSVTGIVGCGDTTTPFDCSTVNGGQVTVNSNGRFTFRPAAGSTAADSFQYVLTDNGIPAPASSNVTVNLTFVGNRIWFVKNNQAAGGLGRSNDPFNTLAQAQTAANAANDRVFVYAGDGTTTGQNAGFSFQNNNQTLQGEAIALTTGTTVNGITNATLVPAGSQPLIGNAAGIGVSFTNRIGTTVTGLSIAGSTQAVQMTTSAAATGTSTITNNTIRGAGNEGIDVNINTGTTGTVTLALTNNSWNTAGTLTGNAIDVNHVAGAGTLNLNLSGNTNVLSTGGAGIVVAGGAVANTTITGFAGNSVHGNTAGAGVNISNVGFDSDVAAGGIQQVAGGNLAVGVSGNPVGGAGLAVTSSQGNLFFANLNVFAASGTGLQLSGPSLTFAVTPAAPDGAGTSTIDADNGAGADITSATIDLRLADLHSDTSVAGLNLSSVGGQFRAPTGSSITKASGAGTAFTVATSVSGTTVTYGGTLNVTSGGGVSLTNNTGSTISFTNTLTLSTGANAAFSATGPGPAATSGGTVSVTGANNTLTTTTATALNVQNTTIGVSGLAFKTISAGIVGSGPASGIVLDNTGSSGGLTVAGNANASVGGDSSGGTIRSTTGHGISLNSTLSPSFTNMNIQSTAGSGINGTTVTNFTFANGTINNSGDAVGESNIAFNGSGALSGNNIAGTLSVTNSVLTNGFDCGIHAENNAGTITNATITGNTFTSTTDVATSKGDAVRLVGTGTTSTVGTLTRATISSNTITNFPGGGGIQVNYGNSNSTGPRGEAGIPNDATNIVTIANNTIRGASAAVRMNTSPILFAVSGGNSTQRSRGNANIFCNGNTGSGCTATGPMTNMVGTGIGIGNNGFSDMTAVVDRNVIVANNGFGSQGIGGGNGVVLGCGAGRCETPNLSLVVTNNNISQTDGNGILLVGRGNGTGAILNVGIRNNTVAAPLGGVRPGIRVDAGNANSVDDAVCLDISGNTTAGSSNTSGIGLRKQGTVATTNDFGIEGMAATSSPGVEQYVGNGAGGKNPGSANGNGDGSINGVLLISAASGFSNCNTAP